MNPNWTAYAHSQGLTPAALPAGIGTNTGFMAWITEQKDAYTAATGATVRTAGWHDRFSTWLTTRHPAPEAVTA